MDKKNVGNTKNVYMLGGIAFFLILTAVFASLFHRSDKERQAATTYAFDGWYFGREDQKKVGSVLGSAGLDDYSWDSGKLSVPTSKKNEYQSALAVAGAYPKAPSESRLEALRESSVFESDSKLRMRELNACATQLERTIEQMRGVEYATVGYRSRREQSGLVVKNVVTASVGVALKEGTTLDSNFLTAITIAAKHQLGIDEADDVSILDLKAGKSYLGVDNSRDSDNSDVIVLEKERVENYWRDKYLEAFNDIEGVRVSVVAELTDMIENVKDENKASGARLERGRDALELRTAAYLRSNKEQSAERAKNEFDRSPRDGLAIVDARSLTSEDAENVGFARLGNPKKRNARPKTTNQVPLLATVGESDVQTKGLPTKLQPLEDEDLGLRIENDLVAASYASKEAPREQGAVGASDKGEADYLDDANNACALRSRRSFGGVAQAGYFEKNNSNAKGRAANAGLVLRSIIVRIAVPESHVQRVFQRVVAEKNKEKTFEERSTEELEALYRDTETKIVDETKNFAVALFRPTSERLGWKDDALENSFYVDVFSDASISNDASTIDFISKYASFDVLEGTPDSKEQTDQKKDADASDADSTSSSVGALADTLGKIAEIATTEESFENDQKSSWGERLRAVGAYCLKISKSKYALYTVLADVVGGLFYLYYVWRKKSLKKKREAASSSTRTSEPSVESPKIPCREETAASVGDQAETYDDELERELLNIASRASSKRGEVVPKIQNDSTASNERDFWEQRRTALDLIAKYPERAAASLQSWVKTPS